jgi:hypothetical protein
MGTRQASSQNNLNKNYVLNISTALYSVWFMKILYTFPSPFFLCVEGGGGGNNFLLPGFTMKTTLNLS